MPALETVAGVAVRRLEIYKNSCIFKAGSVADCKPLRFSINFLQYNSLPQSPVEKAA